MFDDLVLGVDPGTASVGLAVVGRGGGRPSVRWAGTLRTPVGLRPEARLRLLHEGVGEAIRLHRPAVMALERLLWGRNTQSAMAVARASGVIMLAASEAGVPTVGYGVLAPALTLSRLPPMGRQARIFTRLLVRDDAMVLYGFATPDERGLFDLLITVTGVGPKVALAILSVLSPDVLRRAVASGDVAALTLGPGV